MEIDRGSLSNNAMTDKERDELCAAVSRALPRDPGGYEPQVGVYVPIVGTERNLLFATTGATPEECMGRMRAALAWKP